MNFKPLAIILSSCIFFTSPIHAQLLTEVISRFDSLSRVTYKMTLREKDLFSDNISNDTINAKFSLSNNKKLFKVTGAKIQEVYDGNKLIKFDLKTHTYSIANSIENSIFQYRSLPYIINSLKNDINKNVPIEQLSDSIINGNKYYHIKITELDKIEKGKRAFIIVNILLDKESYLPIYYRSDQQGFVDGTNSFVDTYSDMHFFDYKLNDKSLFDFSDIEIPSTFAMERPKTPKSLLVKGTKAPELNLKDKFGKAFKLKSHQGKIVLLNFTLNGCQHCMESINMLNTLYVKYGKKDFLIVSINPFDNKESTEKYNNKFHIEYPFFINATNETSNVDNYNVEGYPTFYLIDKKGNIIKGVTGYDKSIDEELNNLIKKHL